MPVSTRTKKCNNPPRNTSYVQNKVASVYQVRMQQDSYLSLCFQHHVCNIICKTWYENTRITNYENCFIADTQLLVIIHTLNTHSS